jgi:CheY-like chemotaxis protein
MPQSGQSDDLPTELLRVLIADPDEDTRVLYRHVLQRDGCDVMEASDGRDALIKALVGRPSLVITEIHLPLIDGYTLCDILRQDALTHSLPILVVTTDARPIQMERMRLAGADAVLVKPTPPDTLLNEMRRLFARADAASGMSRETNVAPLVDRPVNQSTDADRHQPALSKSYRRFTTTTPPASPPALVCPSCDRTLSYDYSHLGGVSLHHPEQWDYYTCPGACGTFQHRQRTRKLRHIQ